MKICAIVIVNEMTQIGGKMKYETKTVLISAAAATASTVFTVLSLLRGDATLAAVNSGAAGANWTLALTNLLRI